MSRGTKVLVGASTASLLLLGMATSLLLGVVSALPVEAHEKWFVDSTSFPVQWGDAFSLKTAFVLAVAFAGVVTAWGFDRLYQAICRHQEAVSRLAARVGLDRLLGAVHAPQLRASRLISETGMERISRWVPLLLGIHAAVPLIVNGVQRHLFAPNLHLPGNIFGGIMALAEILIGLSFIYGALTRVFAVALIALFPLGFFFFTPAYVLEHLDLAGVAVVLFIVGRGPFSLDALAGRWSAPAPRLLPHAVSSLRVLTGCAIVVAGFTEKIWNERLALNFLTYRNFNFMPELGFRHFTNQHFILVAGTMEVLIGAVLISGKLTRLVIPLVWVPFNLTLPYLGWVELVGHLSMYGIMAVLLVWGAGQDLSPYLGGARRARGDVPEFPVGSPDLAGRPSREVAPPRGWRSPRQGWPYQPRLSPPVTAVEAWDPTRAMYKYRRVIGPSRRVTARSRRDSSGNSVSQAR